MLCFTPYEVFIASDHLDQSIDTLIQIQDCAVANSVECIIVVWSPGVDLHCLTHFDIVLWLGVAHNVHSLSS